MIDKNIVWQLVDEYLKGSDIFLVAVDVKPGNIIAVEIDHDNGISIDDCVALTKYIESKQDRDVEDYELEVGSAGISQPFKILRQYIKNIGNEVEVLTKAGKKLTGILKNADENGIILTIEKQVKPEGSKRKVTIEEDLPFRYEEIKYTKYSIRFK
ncbi:MAG: ribosome assembly cofactor RimP [Dysgonamonadaceae bacterium]|jgi:ribosome maturation factor RimP|nr:ribosome assembly cofactor RimP [Dysgonamonadaceae bacterium]